MPLLLITMPLVLVPMTPGAELDLGNALVPVTGIVLLLRNLLEGDYWESLRYLPVVALVTLACCVASIRWAVEQFNSEAVLFRESERLDLGLWLKHVFRDRQPTPTASAAVVCGVSILMLKFFVELAARQTTTFRDFAVQAVLLQVAVILDSRLDPDFQPDDQPCPDLASAPPRLAAIPAAMLLALLLHPAIGALRDGGDATLSHPRGSDGATGRAPGHVHLAAALASPCRHRPDARRVRGIGVSRIHPLGLSPPGPQMASDPVQRGLLRPGPRAAPAVHDRLRCRDR